MSILAVFLALCAGAAFVVSTIADSVREHADAKFWRTNSYLAAFVALLIAAIKDFS